MENERIVWIDTLRGIGIFLVVLGHTILPYPALIYVFSFHMPLFFFVSGFVFFPEKYKDWKSFLKRNITTLLLPYLAFYLINYGYWLVAAHPQNIWDPLWRVFFAADYLYTPFTPLWFLPALFITKTFFFFLTKLSLKKQIAWVITIVVTGYILGHFRILIPLAPGAAMVGLFFYFIGYLFRTKFEPYAKMASWALILLTVLFLAGHWIAAFYYDPRQPGFISRTYGRLRPFLTTALTGIFGYAFLVKWLKTTVFKNFSFWEFLGRNTLTILGLHIIVFDLIRGVLKYVFHLMPQESLWLSLAYTFLTIALLIPVIHLVNTKVPFLVGYKMKKEKKYEQLPAES